MTDFKITDKSGIKLKTANKYVMEDLTVTLTDDDINNTVAENIKKGISILGVAGTYDNSITGVSYSNYTMNITGDSQVQSVDINKGQARLTVNFNGQSDYSINVNDQCEVEVNANGGTVTANNLLEENIKEGVTILGKTGTHKGGSGEDRLKKLLDATKSAHNLFYEYTGTSVDDLIQYSDTENVTSTSYMFNGCNNLQSIPQLNTSNVTDMKYMFYSCYALTTTPQLDTSKVTRMEYMFANCSKLQTLPQLDTRNVTRMEYMFASCKNLQSIPQLDTNNVTNMSKMFTDCLNLQAIPQLNTSKVTNMSNMFDYCEKLQTIDLTHMKITNSSYSSNMCIGCFSLTKFIIRNMDTIPTLNSNAFTNCCRFTGTTNATYNPQGLKDGRIYVPDNMVNQLKQATNWSKYADIIVPLSTLVE